jgi:hypothetical protein
MMNIEKIEKERIKLLYESHGIILSEENIWGEIAKKALSWAGKNEDDIAKIFKTSEVVLAKSIDDIVSGALKSKNIVALDDIQAKLMHFYNPSSLPANVPNAQKQMVNFLNGFSKSKGKVKWSEFRDEVQGIKPNVTQGASQSASHVVPDMFKGKRVGNYSFVKHEKDIDWSNILNNKEGMKGYNETIARAIKTGDYQYVSNRGFEKFGITKFRDYLKQNILKINEVDPSKGIWDVTFK